MIVRKVIIIHLKEGVTAKLLLTPALYGIAKERGIEIFAAPTDKEDTRSLEQYVKIAYCAAILAWEVGAVDDPDQGEFPYTFEDFHLWSYDNPRDFGKAIDAILIALTGKSARQYIREAEEATDEKKKTDRSKRWHPFRWITGKLKRSS